MTQPGEGGSTLLNAPLERKTFVHSGVPSSCTQLDKVAKRPLVFSFSRQKDVNFSVHCSFKGQKLAKCSSDLCAWFQIMVSQPTERRTLSPPTMVLIVGMWIACIVPQRSFWAAPPTWPLQLMSTGVLELSKLLKICCQLNENHFSSFSPSCPQLLHDSGWNSKSLWS